MASTLAVGKPRLNTLISREIVSIGHLTAALVHPREVLKAAILANAASTAFVHDHPSVKMLALAFLLLIGVTLVADGFGFHIDKAYIYAAMGFSVLVEGLNLRSRRKRPKPVELRPTFVKEEAERDLD